ncbi:hypothetical protein V6M85_09060 [Sulfolobus tengchongensis]|uniref:Uncharacterized protein n=1 Tax=Sulfolobus tengchongensis TaxID=207809 RepID=A0AAX4KXP2_9CREN
MRLGLYLISLGILIVALGEVTFPLSTTVHINGNGMVMVPSWYEIGRVIVNNGSFLIIHRNNTFNLINKGEENLEQHSIVFGVGNAIVILENYKIFYNSNYRIIGLSFTGVGIVLEIVRLIIKRFIKSKSISKKVSFLVS